MTLRLTLLRHAHASDAPPGGEDFDRPLSAQGRTAAGALGAQLAAELQIPDRLRVSSAVRTRETSQLVCGTAWPALAADLTSTLYLASLDTLLREIATTPSDCAHLMIVGHNPGLSELWSMIGREPGFDGLSPCAWRSRTFDVRTWRQVAD